MFKTDKFYGPASYSQNGEDLILNKIFTKQNGHYVDVGAHHPFRYSNTYLLYKNGWSGINIEPTPGSKQLFDTLRKRDINLEIAIGKKATKKFYMFWDSALNTFSKKRADKVMASKQSKLKKLALVKIIPLNILLNKYTQKYCIDLLNVDTEGMEMEILKTNNWNKYSPKIIAIEHLGQENIINNYLNGRGYNLINKTKLTSIYQLDD
ncbi:hypothetical protein A2V80_01455 [Candidatus Woesebacteria bacterium RBG_16_39_8b]|uniref:Methyltransferase FkbM domain-containing protein n=1 Tax=Candidatus Woesebacteria bacterium RBG_16_39_8b TaxID=1802482 RepID=A0A1F7XIF8_9BACT|nr:MAG: hypothetical protein A2V80_01455 [Candidatus Woesebacteria bacterium RBG_16_39_8b]